MLAAAALVAAGCGFNPLASRVSDPRGGVRACSTPGALDAGDERRGLLRVDVDGDGRRDAVAVLADYSGPPNCRFFLAVDPAVGELLTVELRDPIVGEPSAVALRDHPEPRLSAVAEIDGIPGLEMLVTLAQSASGGGVGVFAAHGDQLVRLRRAGSSDDDLFWSNHHNYVVSGVDCQGRLVVSTSAERDPLTWLWTARRTFLHVDRLRFWRVGDEVRTIRDLARLPEFRPDNLWFRDCAGFRVAPLARF